MSATETTPAPRHIPDRLDKPLRSAIFSWEALLVAVAVAIFIVNSFASPYFLDVWSLSDLTFNFTEKGLIALAMALLIISGEIDLSVAAIIALASTLMGMAVQVGVDTPGLVLIGVGVGLVCGAFNGLLVDRRLHATSGQCPEPGGDGDGGEGRRQEIGRASCRERVL